MTDPTAPAGAPAMPAPQFVAPAAGRPLPTAHDRSFIPYPLGADPKFERCLADTEAQEGVRAAFIVGNGHPSF